jgi:hypothetical protein
MQELVEAALAKFGRSNLVTRGADAPPAFPQ